MKEEKDLVIDTLKAQLNEELLLTYGVASDEITEAKEIAVEVYANENLVSECSVTVVKIGASWYVYSAATDTASLYSFYTAE